MKLSLFLLIALGLISCSDKNTTNIVEANIDHIVDSMIQITFTYNAKEMHGQLKLKDIDQKVISSGKVKINIINGKGNNITFSPMAPSEGKILSQRPKISYSAIFNKQEAKDSFIHVKMHILKFITEVNVAYNSDGFIFIPSTGITSLKHTRPEIYYKWAATTESGKLDSIVCNATFHSLLINDSITISNPVYMHYNDTLVLTNSGVSMDSFFMVSAISKNSNHQHYKNFQPKTTVFK